MDDAKNAFDNAKNEVIKAIISKIPLTDLKEHYSSSNVLEKEKSNAEGQLKDVVVKLKKEIENGLLQLQYAENNYEQFAIKDLKQ